MIIIKKINLVKVLAVVCLLMLPLMQPAHSASGDWATIRSVADGIRVVNNNVRYMVTTLRSEINTYGLSIVIANTQAQNGGDGMNYMLNGNLSYLLVKEGNFNISTGIANGKSFKYLMLITDTSLNPKLKFYFNNINDIYGEETLLLFIPYYCIDTFLPENQTVELRTYKNISGNNTVDISVGDTDITSGGHNNIRLRTKSVSGELQVMSLIYHNNNFNDTFDGYYTLAFVAKTTSPHYCIALQGAHDSTTTPTNNGRAYPGDGTNHNYAYFYDNSGTGAWAADQLSSDSNSNYPAISKITGVFSEMTSSASYFNNSSGLDTLTIDITNAGYPIN